MSREFKCSKCESKDVAITLKDYISHFSYDERVPEFLACTCRVCQNFWKEIPSDQQDKEKEQG